MTFHPYFKTPENNNIKLWRYIDLAKFMSLIQNKALFFTRADKLGDNFEGSTPKANIKKFHEIAANASKLSEAGYQDSQDFNNIHLKDLPQIKQIFVKRAFITCWHMNDHESATMWKIYGHNNNAICVQSTFQKLKNNLQNNKNIYTGIINYIDYEKELIRQDNLYAPFLHKRSFFKDEQEVRSIFFDQNYTQNESGVLIPINLKSLIENIYINPLAEKWLIGVIESILVKYELDCIKVNQSSLAQNELW